MRNIVVLTADSEPRSILPEVLAAQAEEFNGQVAAVVSSTQAAPGLRLAQESDVPTAVVEYDEYRKWGKPGALYEEDLAHRLQQFSPDLVVLDNWSLTLSRQFLRYFPWRVIKASQGLWSDEGQPVKLPDGTFADPLTGLSGQNATQAVLASGQTYTGATVHVVLDALDAGPVIRRGLVGIEEGDTVERLYESVKRREAEIMIESLRDLCLDMTAVS